MPVSVVDPLAADAYVLRLYRKVLQREPADSERIEWRSALLSGMEPTEIRAAFLASDEYRQKIASAERKAAIVASGLFDAEWYLRANPDVANAGMDALAHYCGFGAQEHRAPNAWFNDDWYRERTSIEPDTDALLDYIARGERLNHPPGPHFDPAWYRAAYGLDAATSPLAHFLAYRSSRLFAPCPQLWSVAQLASNNPAPTAADPFLPFLTAGDDLAERAAPDVQLLESSGLFDRNHYQIINADVAEAHLDALVHYCVFGWKEGRSPNFYFDQRWYLETNPEVQRLRVNPLLHYLLAGEPNDRRPSVFFEPGWYRRTYDLPSTVSPLAHYLANRHTQQFSPNALFDPAWYLVQCKEAPRARRDLFAHYLVFGMHSDVQPSPGFDAAEWRRRTTGRPSRHFQHQQTPERDNPLVNYMLAHYR